MNDKLDPEEYIEEPAPCLLSEKEWSGHLCDLIEFWENGPVGAEQPSYVLGAIDKLYAHDRALRTVYTEAEQAWKVEATARVETEKLLVKTLRKLGRFIEVLQDCEEVLRVIHEAAGPIQEDTPMPRLSTFEVWKQVRELLDASGSRVCEETATAPMADKTRQIVKIARGIRTMDEMRSGRFKPLSVSVTWIEPGEPSSVKEYRYPDDLELDEDDNGTDG